MRCPFGAIQFCWGTVWKILRSWRPSEGNIVLFAGWAGEHRNKGRGFHPVVIMRLEWKKFHVDDRIHCLLWAPQAPALSLFRPFSPKSLRFVCLPGMWDSRGLKLQPFLSSRCWALCDQNPSYLFWRRKQCHFTACMQNSWMPEIILLKLPANSLLGWD